MVVETNWYDKRITRPSPLGLDLILVPSANRANIVYRDLHGCHSPLPLTIVPREIENNAYAKFLGVNKVDNVEVANGGYFEVLFAFDVGLVSLSRKEYAIGLQKNILTLSF